MSDSHSEYQYDYSTRGPYGAFRRGGNAIGTAILGFFVFIASFGVLYWNENQVDSTSIAKKAVIIDAAKEGPNSKFDGNLVMVSGKVVSNGELGDEYLKPDNYLALLRKVEMYSWVETKSTREYEEMDGTTVKKTTYSYNKQWKSTPESSSNFKDRYEHVNPSMTINNSEKKSQVVKIGEFTISPEQLAFPAYQKLNLSKDNIQLSNDILLASDQYLFKGKGSLQSPQIGDVRISYLAVNSDFAGTALGLFNDGSIQAYNDKRTNKNLARLFVGGRENALGKMQSEYEQRLWMFRGLGLFLMWIGICMFFEPLNVSLHILPVVGSFLSGIAALVTGFISLIIAVILTAITLLVINIIKNIYVLIGVIILSFVLCLFVIKKVSHARKELPV
ncbi:MAG: TMEM43 family protein [Ignavibacteriales bacterium]